MDHATETDLLNWSNKQGSILTSAGLLNDFSEEGRDFEESDLPHYHLKNRSTRDAFCEWLSANRRSFDIVGCWARPLFTGGFKEDTSAETIAFNLQTPSMFIDMRFPVLRPSDRLRARGSLQACSDDDLRYLARQHCFSGYSLPSQENQYQFFTRHHIIDWNYHPAFPRPRPNKWWVQLDNESDETGANTVAQSFKEFSFVRDQYNVPIYFERWSRIKGDGNGKKYLAMRRNTGCPMDAIRQGRQPERDGVIIVVGNHFAYAVNRPMPIPEFDGSKGPGGPALVDYALSRGGRVDAERYLDLEGSYGTVDQWQVQKSTHPWKEGQSLLPSGSKVTVRLGRRQQNIESIDVLGYNWTILECSFSIAELQRLFAGARVSVGPSKL
jgi:hypothetical protein